MAEATSARKTALAGLKVIDAATFFAGPLVATMMADFGADVIKVEHPRGDPVRQLGWQKNGLSLWWLLYSRNKRCVTADLGKPQGAALLKELIADADVLIENYRPGTMDAWGLGYEHLGAINPKLIYVSTTGYGQTGPYRDRAGFGAVGEAISGFAHITGEAGGRPQLSSFGLADQVAGVYGTFATMFALYHRDKLRTGKGQHVDVSLYESMFSLCGPQAPAYDQLGIVQTRTGNRMPYGAPRNTYPTGDGRWIAVSSASLVSAKRIMSGVGRGDLAEQPWFETGEGRVEHVEEIDEAIGDWVGQHPGDEVIATFEQFEAVAAPIYSIVEMFADPQFIARDTITTVDDPRYGPVRIQNVVPKLSRTPGGIRHLGPELGEHNREIYADRLGHSPAELESWQREGVI